jgi:plastocyanin
MRRHRRSLALALAVCWALAPAVRAEEGAAGTVRGRLRLAVEGARIADVGPIVAYLEPLAGTPTPPPPAGTPKVYQKDARFSPAFLAIAAGQTVSMPNDDAIYHNVFSYSTPNDFDLGLYPAGEARSVTFRHAGVVRTYCSIHESMSGTIFVAPTRSFVVVRATGEFEIRDVPAGRYRLKSWADRIPSAAREIEVRAGQPTSAELVIGATP